MPSSLTSCSFLELLWLLLREVWAPSTDAVYAEGKKNPKPLNVEKYHGELSLLVALGYKILSDVY